MGLFNTAMNPAVQLLAPLALLFPAIVAVDQDSRAERAPPAITAPVVQQVRIEQSITIRINPRAAPMPNVATLMAEGADGGAEPRFYEHKAGKCLALGAIAAVQPLSDDRLLLMLRDSRLFAAKLAKGCQAREYYSGFIVKRNADGQVCVGRDELLSRTGASCQVRGFSQLVPAGD